MIVTLKHNSTERVVKINCISWDYSKKGNVYEFFSDDSKQIYYSTYCVYNWDLEEIDYNK